MKLTKQDFTGEGAEDFKYGFRMPLKCLSDTNCEWICQKMVKVDGASDDVINSDQNVKIEDLDADDEQQFESDLVIVDDADETDLPADDTPTNNTNTTKPSRRVLAESNTVAVAYDANGYEADSETYSTGVIVDDPAFGEELVVPED